MVPGENAARDLAAREKPDAEVLGACPGFGQTGNAVVVCQCDRLAACGHGQFHDSCGSLRAIRAGGVHVQVDHNAERSSGLPAIPDRPRRDERWSLCPLDYPRCTTADLARARPEPSRGSAAR